MSDLSVTSDQIAAVVAGGPYWWMRPDGSLHSTDSPSREAEGDIYLLRATQVWIDQWDGDWQKAADQINEAIARNQNES